MTRVLEGVKVLELAEHGFVPSAAAVLGDWGADVVKVERPEGDPLRHIMAQGLVADTGDFNFVVEQMNRNKRNVGIDLRKPEARVVFDRLVAWADVFITNQLPRVRRKLRVEPEDLFAVNPRLVYARGHGQGARGPDAEAGGFDSVSFWSRAGVGHMLSGPGTVVMQRPAMGDGPTGMFLAGGIAAALYGRERSGRGVVVDVSLLAGGIWTLAPDLVATSVLGREPAKAAASTAISNPLVGTFQTSDGRVLMLSMLAADKYWQPTCDALELPELARDPANDTAEKRAPRARELRARFEKAIASKPLAHWEPRLSAAGCIFSKFASPLEVLEDPQVRANDYMPAHPVVSRARLASSPVQFDGEPVQIRRPAPRVGEHTDEVLGSLGVDPAERAALRRLGAIV